MIETFFWISSMISAFSSSFQLPILSLHLPQLMIQRIDRLTECLQSSFLALSSPVLKIRPKALPGAARLPLRRTHSHRPAPDPELIAG